MIHILTTGGTIEGLDYEKKINVPEEIKIAIADFLSSANVSFNYTIDNAFRKDSRFITQEDRDYLMKRINVAKATKILITHGTFTMKETAEYLAKLSLGKTIVLTGALILGTDKHTDAPFNLGFAISALEFLDKGVYIAMNGKVFSWDNVRKNLETNRFEKLYE